ncbi:MAG: hypothetical protein U0841_31150 [Chloroflexia bacterium]
MTRARVVLAGWLVLAILLAAVPNVGAATDQRVLDGFNRTWARTDEPEVRGGRTYIWGPRSLLPTSYLISEPLAGLPGDQRPVLYWDKSRMEVNDPNAPPDQWYVTNGLLVSEMVQGRIQIGVNPTRYADRAPAEISFGDLDDTTGPTFKSFREHLNDPPLASNAPVAQGIDRAGKVSPSDAGGVTCRAVVQETKHCIASPFWDFLNQQGTIYEPDAGGIVEGGLFNPLFYATGLPISEAYWITVKAAGKQIRVLVQLFERRTLTYNPAHAPAIRVEMGNVGLQYFNWRYTALQPGDPQTGLDPAMRAAIAAVWDASPAYRYLPQAVAGRYQLFFQDLPAGEAYGLASRQYQFIMIDLAYQQNPRDAATILAHEMQHARDFNAYGAIRNANECYAWEVRAFLTEASLWQLWYGPEGKPGATDPLEREENAILRQVRTDPAGFARSVVQLYAGNDQCPQFGAGGNADRLLTLEGLPEGIADQLPVAQVFAGLRSTFTGGAIPGSPKFVITAR